MRNGYESIALQRKAILRGLILPNTDIVIGKALRTQAFAITTTPIQILDSTEPRPYALVNPSGLNVNGSGTLVDAVFETELFPLLARLAGTYTSTLLTEAALYDRAYVFIDETVEVGATNLSIRVVNEDMYGNILETALLNPAVVAIGQYFRFVVPDNVSNRTGIRVVQTGAGTATWRMSIELKGPVVQQLAGGAGSDMNIYIGNNGDVSPISGFPVVPQVPLYIATEENAQLWAVATQPLTLNLLDMGL